MENKIERRAFDIKVRAAENGEKKLVGMPIVYNRSSENMGFFEYIAPGAAAEALKTSDALLLYGHESKTLLPIARQSSGTLRAIETDQGVEIEADPPRKNAFVDALLESIERGDVREMSFGFTVLEDEWSDLDKDTPVRTVRKIGKLYDFSYVVFPAYLDAKAGIRDVGLEVAFRSLEAARAANTNHNPPTGSNETGQAPTGEESSPMAADPPTAEEIEARFNQLNDWKRNF
ncbi:HK97 family phage prohead protease [Desulfuromonas thiophila]|uniref:Prohead serine protease domain-containing protein n=1 Tax=Desulfuromonas thiophila TaxID=57664 RepID=A0A1G7B4A5_9BACT|nr:HK97 family phage prohead protease [Desulfuromonas thiophila]SDE21065.1 hypothetical protein SAMN05661003_10525 [Desulfuromonas thiophila]